MKRATLVILATLAFGAPATAADSTGDYRIKGLGLQSCADFLNSRNSQDKGLYILVRSWVNGYLTAFNTLQPRTYDVAGNASIGGISGWMEQFCEANPGVRLEAAVTNLVAALAPNRLAEKPKGPAVAVDQPTMSRVQQALKDQGLYEGTVDGVFGPGTQSAIAAFQRTQGLPITGQPDQNTLARLLN